MEPESSAWAGWEKSTQWESKSRRITKPCWPECPWDVKLRYSRLGQSAGMVIAELILRRVQAFSGDECLQRAGRSGG